MRIRRDGTAVGPRCRNDYSVPVYSSGGFNSLSAVRQIVDRALARERAHWLLHVGDFDPSGVSIFEAIAADVSAFVNADRVINTLHVEPRRVALTADQVATYGLPTAPAKASDSRSRSWRGETCQLESSTNSPTSFGRR